MRIGTAPIGENRTQIECDRTQRRSGMTLADIVRYLIGIIAALAVGFLLPLPLLHWIIYKKTWLDYYDELSGKPE